MNDNAANDNSMPQKAESSLQFLNAADAPP